LPAAHNVVYVHSLKYMITETTVSPSAETSLVSDQRNRSIISALQYKRQFVDPLNKP